MFRKVIEAAAAALRVPLMPAPARGGAPCATYVWQPGAPEGAGERAVLTVRVFAPVLADAEAELARLTAALATDGDRGALADGEIVIRAAGAGASGHVRAAGLYYMTARYDVRA